MGTDVRAPEHINNEVRPPSAPPPPPTTPRRRRKIGRWIVLLLLVAAAVGFYEWRSRQPAAAPAARTGRGGRGMGPMVVPVSAAKAQRGDIPVYLDGLGSVSPFYTVTVRSRVDGQLMSVAFREGQYVKAGDVLAEIDPRPFQAALEQAEGTLARDKALLVDAKLDLERYRTLLAQEAIAKQQLDTQVATVGQYEGIVKSDQAAIDTAKLNLVYARITAPISGVVGLRLVDPGNIVHATDTNGMLVITQVQPIATLFTIPEDSLPAVLQKLRAGAKLPIDAFNRDKSQKLSSGYLLTVDNQIDQTTGTSRLKGVFENTERNLFPNQFINIRLLVEMRHGQVIVPSVAIQRGAQGTFVFVVKPDSTVQVRVVSVGIVEGNDTSIDSGLNAGETVVIDGADKLLPGGKVSVRPTQGGGTKQGGAKRRKLSPGGGPAS